MNFIKINKNLLLVVLILIILPLLINQRYLIHTMVLIFLFAAMGVAWNLIGGYGAQLSLGHAAFLSIGAYTSFIMLKGFNMIPYVSLIIGIIIAAVIATIIGYPSFRVRGPYFTLSTIAFAEIFRLLLLYFKDYTGGANGIVIPFKGQNALLLQFLSETPYYYISLLILSLFLYLSWTLENSRIGYFLRAIKEDEDAAESLGIKTYLIKLIIFLISAAMTSITGVILAFNSGYIDPSSVGSIDLSVRIAVIVIIGGIGTLWGPVLGALIIIPLTEISNALLGNTRGGASMALYGLILMLIVIFQPSGMMEFINSRTKLKRSV